MRSQTLPLITAAGIGFAAAAILFSVASTRPAAAQFKGAPPLGQIPAMIPGSGGSGTTAMPQPIEVQALDADHFVVATREPRLAQNMLVTVVTHYTVRGDKLFPIEHVRVPAGFRLITIEE
jgi:hypothetical protein